MSRRGRRGGGAGRTDRERHAARLAPEPAEVASAARLGAALAWLFLAVGGLLLVLAVAGGGWLHLLGALAFLAVGGVLIWAVRSRPRSAPRQETRP